MGIDNWLWQEKSKIYQDTNLLGPNSVSVLFWGNVHKTDNFLVKVISYVNIGFEMNSSLEILLLSPQSKFLGRKRTSRTGRQDGQKKANFFLFQVVNFAVWKCPFLDFFENCQNRQFWSANFSMKTAPTEKTEYTTAKATENARKLSSQIFDFWTFVTEIFKLRLGALIPRSVWWSVRQKLPKNT